MGWQDQVARDVRGNNREVVLTGVGRVSTLCWARANGSPQEVHGVRFVGFSQDFQGDDRPFLCWDGGARAVVLAGGQVQALRPHGNRHGWVGPCPVLAWEGVTVFDQPMPELAWHPDADVLVLRGAPEGLVAEVEARARR